MKKYISNSRKVDEIKKQQQEWQSRYDARKAEYNSQQDAYDEAYDSWEGKLKTAIENQFQGTIDKLPGLNIRVECNVYAKAFAVTFDNSRGYESCSLRWDYTIKLQTDGNVKFESSSWSGLAAVTPMQVLDLKNTADFLKEVIEFDGWAELLSNAFNTKPDWEKFVTISNPEYDFEYRDPGYDKMIQDAELLSYVGKNYWLKGRISDYGGWYDCYIQLLSIADKTYKINYIFKYTVDSGYQNIKQDRKYKKKVKFNSPIEAITDEEFNILLEQKRQEWHRD